MYETTIEVAGKPTTFSFRRMKPEEAIEWSSKIKSRIVYRETLERELEEEQRKPLISRSDDLVLNLTDRITHINLDLVAQAKKILDWIEKPAKAELDSMFSSNTEAVLAACQNFLKDGMMSEDDRKKSSGASASSSPTPTSSGPTAPSASSSG